MAGNIDNIKLKKLIYLTLSKWYYFVIASVIFFSLAILYTRYTKKVYRSSSTILIKDSKQNKIGAENLIESLELLSTNENIDNQIGILTSYSLIRTTIESLNFNISYFAKGNVVTNEIYGTTPFVVVYDTLSPQALEVNFHLQILDSNQFRLWAGEGIYQSYDLVTHKELEIPFQFRPFDRICQFDSIVKTNNFSFIIEKGQTFNEAVRNTTEFHFILRDIDKVTREFRSALKVEPTHKWSSILKLTLDSNVPLKTIDFLDQLSAEYIAQNIDEKNEIVESTIEFIDEQLRTVTKDLYNTEFKLETYKKQNNFVDLDVSSLNLVQNLDKLQKEKSRYELEKKYFDYLLVYITSNNTTEKVMAPSISGIENELLIKKVNELNELLSKRRTLDFAVKKDNPRRAILDGQIDNVKKVLVENVKNIQKTSQIRQKDLQGRLSVVKEAISQLPRNERELINIERIFDFNNALFKYLLEKKAEAGIAKAANKSDHRILDRARLDTFGPISPNTKVIYLAALILAFASSYSIITVTSLLDNKLRDISQITETCQVPVLGVITKSGHGFFPLSESPKSSTAESFRTLRVNLKYIKSDTQLKVLGLTSAESGEGKSFCTINIAHTLALTNAKVLIIDADLRKPSLSKHFDKSEHAGLSNYLINTAKLEEVIYETHIEGISIIPHGPLPPNPSELLGSDQLKILMDKVLDQYDYIIFDTSPVGLVSDYMVLKQHIQAHLFVARANYSSLEVIDFVNDLTKDDKFTNMYMVLNGIENRQAHYGYGNYVYG